ncbi:MAG: glycoside hydrolase domain-containing protein, partial [Phycisphaeraceae bacterium JB051]
MILSAQPLNIVTTSAGTTPVVDGVLTAGEWDDAATLDGTLSQIDPARDARPITFWVKADQNKVYIAMQSTVRAREWEQQRPTTWFADGDSSFVIGLAPGTINRGDQPSRYLLRVSLHGDKMMWEVTPQIVGVKLQYPHPDWLVSPSIQSVFNPSQTQWVAEVAIPLSSMNVSSIAEDEQWGLMLARDYEAADPTAIIQSSDWRFGDGKGRHYGRSFYNHYRDESQWAQLKFQSQPTASQIVVGNSLPTVQRPDVPGMIFMPFQKGSGTLVSDQVLQQYGVYVNSAVTTENAMATGYEPFTNEFYGKFVIDTLPDVHFVDHGDIQIRQINTGTTLVTHAVPDLQANVMLCMRSIALGTKRATVLEWVAPADGVVNVQYECRQFNTNSSDGLGFQLVHWDSQQSLNVELVARQQIEEEDNWVPFTASQINVSQGDKIQLRQDRWGHEANDDGRMRGEIIFTDTQSQTTHYRPGAEFTPQQGGSSGVWFYRYDDDLTLNTDGNYDEMLWQMDPRGYEGWMWYPGNPTILNPWQTDSDQTYRRAWGSVHRVIDDAQQIERFTLPTLTPGVYEALANAYDINGNLLGQARQLFVKYDHATDLPWLNHTLGVSTQVLPPWTNMQSQLANNALTVDCWGRTHLVDGSGLFTQVQAIGQSGVNQAASDLLAAPVRIEYISNSQTTVLQPQIQPTNIQQANHQVTWEGMASANQWEVQTQVTMEYDGYALHELTITPPAVDASVDKMRLVIPLKSEFATHLHAAAGDWFRSSVSSIDLDTTQGMLWHSGLYHGLYNDTVGDDWGQLMTAGDFKPYVWIGGPNRGLAFMADNDQGWVPDETHTTHAIEVVRDGDHVLLILNLVGRTFTFDKPRQIKFSLQATPVRPMLAGFRDQLLKLKLQTAFPGFDPDGWDWNGSRLKLDGEYVVSGHGSQFHPLNWDRNASKCASWGAQGKTFTPYQSQLNIMSFGEVDDVRMPAGKQSGNVYGYIYPHMSTGCLEHGNLSMTRPDMEYRLYCYDAWIEHSDLPGMYFDQTEPILGANPVAGAGYIMDIHDRPALNGMVQPGYLLTNVREFYKRLRTLFYEAGVNEPMIWLHTTDANMISAFAFAGAFLDGENTPYITVNSPWFSAKYSPDRMQALCNPSKLGVASVWLDMFKSDWNWPDNPDEKYMAMRSLQGYSLIHDIAEKWHYVDWGALDPQSAMTFYPYWDADVSAGLSCADPNVLVSAHKQGNDIQLIIFNRFDQQQQGLQVQVDFPALGIPVPATPVQVTAVEGWHGNLHPSDLLMPMTWQANATGVTITLTV